METTEVPIMPKKDKQNFSCIHTVKYYPRMKRSEVLIYATTWANLENRMLCEVSKKSPHIVQLYYLKC